MKDQKINRREALSLLGGGAFGAFWLSSILGSEALGEAGRKLIRTNQTGDSLSFNPIDRSLSHSRRTQFSGDEPNKNHMALWDKPKFLASLSTRSPASLETAPLVIIGGGMSGILSAYLLRKYNPIILEQAPRMGGNSRGESWRGVDYSIGAAYFTDPEPGSFLNRLFNEIGLQGEIKIRNNHDPIAFQNQLVSDFWGGATDPNNRKSFEVLKNYFEGLVSGKQGVAIPQIPFTPDNRSEETLRLSNISFKSHLEKIAGGPLHAHLEALIERYCWSTFAASSAEIHAAAGVNFFSSEFQNLCFVPGGNSRIAELTLAHLLKTIPLSRFRAGSMVYDVEAHSNHALVSYLDSKGNPRSIHAKSVVMACPKFIAAKLLKAIEPERVTAIKKIEYRSYLVGNVCVNHASRHSFFDLYNIDGGTSYEQRSVTDTIRNDRAGKSKSASVFTFYRGIPTRGARHGLLSETAFETYQTEFHQELEKSFFPLLGIKKSHIADIRLTRWGHPLPVPRPGSLTDGTVDTIRKPFKERVFFVQQDNWQLPAIETAAAEALYWTPQIEAVIKKSPSA